MRFCGLDEAALGPRLGPFCAGLVEFDRSLECSPTTNLYHLLKNAVASNLNDGGRLAVTDSKKIYSPSRGIQLLEQSVWVFLELAGIGFPQNLHGLVQALCPPGDYARMKESPWFEDPSLTTLPLSDIRMEQIRRQARSVRQSLDSVDLRFRPPRLRFVTAKAFNESLIAHQGKSPAVCSIISPLLTHALNGYDSEPGRLTVDRQGGRRYYGPWLMNLFPGALLQAVEEGPKRSAYAAGRVLVEFLVSADKERLETALASMFAKYLREAAMHSFNCWWGREVSGIQPTAGYPKDADRFLRQLKDADRLPKDQNLLIRRL